MSAPDLKGPVERVHPHDVLFFEEVRAAAFRVAKNYGLRLTDVVPHHDPEYATSTRGFCTADGLIEIAMRGKQDGAWDLEPRAPRDVWETIAHELAHLRHFNHGVQFQEFEEELVHAVTCQQEDHRQKVISKLVKMQASRDSEAKLGNSEAAEAFAAAINRMMLEYELRPSEVDYQRAQQDDPVVELKVNVEKHGLKAKEARVAWQERLATVVANANLCKILIRSGSNDVWFVGTRSHATVAEYAYATLVRAAVRYSYDEHHVYYVAAQRDGDVTRARGFRAAWIDAFITRVDERLREERAAAVRDVPPDVPGGTSTALLRLDQAVVRVNEYLDAKFRGKSRCSAAYLRTRGRNHADGRAWGRAAADRMVIGRRGVGGGTSGKLLK